MGLGRKRGAARAEYAGYIASDAWRARKIRYYEDIRAAGFVPVCQVCGVSRGLDLHHLSYDGVRRVASGVWVSGEADEDLIPLCRADHEELHRVLDTRGRDYRGWSRRAASLRIIRYLKDRKKRQ